MTLAAGTRLGSFEILSPLGAGGMGEVYRARDTRLGRDVAIKVLPAALAADADRLARFEREAHVLAALNHANIAHIHGLEESGAVPALVMELVEGSTLAERITQGPIPLDEVLPIARQIADALDAAHAQGIVHRDLKPANIKVRPDGTVKVLDFGLAKALEGSVGQGRPDLSHSPTLTTPAMTGMGVLLGTAAYMAPEQARGKPVDKRADIWAFGCVLFEMLTGRRAFSGSDISDVLASVIKDTPPWHTLPVTTPAAIRRLLTRCLEKDPLRRLHDIADAQLEIGEALAAGLDVPTPIRPAANRREFVAWSVAAVAILAASVTIAYGVRGSGHLAQPLMQFTLGLPDGVGDPSFLTLSPDGHQVAFLANVPDGRARVLWIRGVEAITARPLPGTDGANMPFWSPTSRSIGFFADGKLKWIDPGNDVVQVICDVQGARGGAWNGDNTIIYSPSLMSPLFRVSAAARSTPVQLTKLATTPHETSHRFPSFLPDGRHFVLTAFDDRGRNSIKLGSLDSPETTELVVVSASAHAVVSEGRLLFQADPNGPLFAQPIDVSGSRLTGQPAPVIPAVDVENFGRIAFALSDTGLLVYRSPSRDPITALKWFSRAGAPLETVGEPLSSMGADWSVSPDGRRLAFVRGDPVVGGATLWVMDLVRQVATRLTTEGNVRYLTWSPDSARIAFGASPGAMAICALYIVAADGNGPAELLLPAAGNNKIPRGWSPDAATMLFQDGTDLWTVPMSGEHRPTPFAKNAIQAAFSPDGEWAVYSAVDSARNGVYVQKFPSGPRVPVASTDAILSSPHWSGDGKQILYRSQGKAMVVDVRKGTTLEIGLPRTLFTEPAGAASWTWQPSRDGQRFLMQVPRPGPVPAPPPYTILVNWTSALAKAAVAR